ncbi:MAG: GDSL-type esterase/lipase family protein [Fibrobacter sp.]|nr:GDSL-type esterase/lipase family protein [Fibrobacter sp.]
MKAFAKYAIAAALFTSVAVSDTTSFTIHVIGDSTVCAYKDSAYPQTGWGQIIGSFFDGSRVKINNVAIGGRSSKTFIQEGRLDALQGKVQKGDFIFVQFGHNDRYFGTKDREVPIDSLDFWLNQYITKAKGWGATPVFVSPMIMNTLPRNTFSTKYSTKGEYDVRDHMEALAKKNQIPFVDLNLKSYNGYKSMNGSYVSRYQFKYFLKGEYPGYPDGVTNDGTTHFQASGSITHSQWIMEELEEELNASYLSADVKAQMTTLVSSIKPRYDLNVKSNVNNSNGLITHNQKLPGGAPLVLHVSPSSFGKKFMHWADDDCNVVSADSNYYGKTMPGRSITYTAIFEGGSACVKTAHGDEISSSSITPTSSSSVVESSSSFDEAVCFTGVADAAWPSPIDMSKPDVNDGTTDTNHEGYTGIGFYNIANSATSKAVYNVTSDQSASNARVMIRYAFAGTDNRDMKFTIDNGTYDVAFPPTGSWDKWDTTYINDVWVDALDFQLTIQSTVAAGGPNIDMIAFDIKDVYRTGCKPAKVAEVPVASSSSQNPQVESSSSSETMDSDVAADSSTAIGKHRIPSAYETADWRSYRTVNLLGRTVQGKKAPGKYFKIK